MAYIDLVVLHIPESQQFIEVADTGRSSVRADEILIQPPNEPIGCLESDLLRPDQAVECAEYDVRRLRKSLGLNRDTEFVSRPLSRLAGSPLCRRCVTYKVLLEVSGISLEFVCDYCQLLPHPLLHRVLLTANHSCRVPTQTNVGNLHLSKDVIRTPGLAVHFVAGPKDAERPKNTAVLVGQEILADLEAAQLQRLRVREVTSLIYGGEGVKDIVGFVQCVDVHPVSVPSLLHDGVEPGILTRKELLRVVEHRRHSSVMAALVLADPAVPVNPAIAAATVRAHEATAEGELCAVEAVVVWNRGPDGRYLADKRRALVEKDFGVFEASGLDDFAIPERVILCAVVIQAEPAGREDLLTLSAALCALGHWSLRARGVGLCGIVDIARPPRGFAQVCLFETDAPNLDLFIRTSWTLSLLPHVGNMEVPEHGVGVGRSARIQRVILAFKGLVLSYHYLAKENVGLPAITATSALPW